MIESLFHHVGNLLTARRDVVLDAVLVGHRRRGEGSGAVAQPEGEGVRVRAQRVAHAARVRRPPEADRLAGRLRKKLDDRCYHAENQSRS